MTLDVVAVHPGVVWCIGAVPDSRDHSAVASVGQDTVVVTVVHGLTADEEAVGMQREEFVHGVDLVLPRRAAPDPSARLWMRRGCWGVVDTSGCHPEPGHRGPCAPYCPRNTV